MSTLQRDKARQSVTKRTGATLGCRVRLRTACLAIVAIALWSLAAAQLAHRALRAMPLDFQVYRDAALNMLHGGATYHLHFTFAHLYFTYPPFALMLMSALTLGTPMIALTSWWLINALALTGFIALALTLVCAKSRSTIVIQSFTLAGVAYLFLQPIRSNFDFGQINIILMLAVLVDISLVRPPFRGILTGVAAAVKLTPLIYVTFFFVLNERRSLARSLGTFVGAALLAWAVLPSDSMTFWLHQAFSPGHKGKAVGPMNQSWFGFVGHFASSLGSATLIIWVVLAAATAVVGFILARLYVSKGMTLDALLALALTEVLVSPVSWTHHWSWVILVPVLLLARPRESWALTLAMSLLLAVAVVAPYRWNLVHWHHNAILVMSLNFSLLFAGAALLITMAVTQWCEGSRKSNNKPAMELGRALREEVANNF
ncbi:MAG: glycosyltransferase 87 family protein [Acidimicrobiales bacterium]